MAAAEPLRSEEPGTSSGSHTWVQGPKTLAAFLGHKQGAGLQEKLGHKLVPRWHAGTAGRVIECYATAPIPSLMLCNSHCRAHSLPWLN